MSKIQHWLEELESGQSWEGGRAESMPTIWSDGESLLWQPPPPIFKELMFSPFPSLVSVVSYLFQLVLSSFVQLLCSFKHLKLQNDINKWQLHSTRVFSTTSAAWTIISLNRSQNRQRLAVDCQKGQMQASKQYIMLSLEISYSNRLIPD